MPDRQPTEQVWAEGYMAAKAEDAATICTLRSRVVDLEERLRELEIIHAAWLREQAAAQLGNRLETRSRIMCMADDADRSTNLGELHPLARKAHQCGECFRAIEPGERYTLSKTLFDGRVEGYKTCDHCAVARDWLGANCGGWLYGGVWEDIEEHIHEYRSVYPNVARQLKRLAVWESHDWKIARGPRAGQRLPVPAMPTVVGEP